MSENRDHVSDYWVKQLSDVQLPVLAGTIKELNAATRSDNSNASKLAEIILRDSALTAKVLRVTNSVYNYRNPSNPITTISRAVVQLGFHAIKAISLSVMMVESLLKQDARERMIEWMARGFHTGIQAKNLVHFLQKDQHAEEVFITSLLLHLGEMAFWIHKDKVVDQLDHRLEPHSWGNSEIERELLGISLKSITRLMVEVWGLEEYVHEALNPGTHSTVATQAVLLAEEICLALEQGWESQALRDVTAKVSMFTGKNPEESRHLIEQGAEEAAGVALSYGANSIIHFIPSMLGRQREDKPVLMQPDLQLQLDVLRDMSSMVQQLVDTNTLFQTVIEGIHRGVGLERVALCLLDSKSNSISARYVLGEDTDTWREEMTFPAVNDDGNLFSHCLHKQQPLWMRPNHPSEVAYLVDRKTRRLVTVENLLLAPISNGNRRVGVIVADRGNLQPPISEQQKESFDYFAQQLSTSLMVMAARRGNMG